MKQPVPIYVQKILDQSKEAIFSQQSLLMAIRRTAWWLFIHEMENGYTHYEALDNVLLWMAEQSEMLERVKREPTQMQRRMLQMLADGKSGKQIARELGKNEQTLRGHFRRVRTRLGVDTMYQVMAISVKKGWITVKPTGTTGRLLPIRRR